jgi:wyosine [tRNA(Phe)-imidazoG37] synthetase (radical SAM superfamily)
MGHVFGPVPSRRLGRSLGIDLVPMKTCTYDCIYCQLGRTTFKTLERREWFPLDEIVQEVKTRLSSRPDYITLAGSGEPTLYSRIGELIERVRSMTDIPVAVLTNGSLLWQEEVRRELMGASLLVPSLDAGNPRLFQAVNRPHPELSFERMLDGLVAMGQEFKGSYRLEVFLLGGYTALPPETREIARCARMIGTSVQLNTVTRPAAEDYASGVDRARMEDLAGLFNPPAEVIADFRDVHARPEFTVARDTVFQMIERRPCTLQDIASGLGIHPNEAAKHVGELLTLGRIEQIAPARGKAFFRARP